MIDARPRRRLVTVMAGYARGNTLPAVTQRWIDALRRLSTQLVLVFDQDRVEGLEEFSASAPGVVGLCERHGAYDFGSYQRGLCLVREQQWLDDATHVLLCNDSVLGPFGDLEAILDGMQQQPVPVWGLTDSPLYRPHLQSYFLLLERDVAAHPAVSNFFASVVPQPSRHAVIQAYELGFSSLLGDLGLAWRAWLPITGMEDPRNGEPMANSTAYPLCLLEAGSPVLKHRALKEVAANQDGLGPTCSVLAEQHPQIWAELWASSPHRRFWQEAITVAILLQASDLSSLEERITWIKAHPHPNLKALVAVSLHDIATRARLTRDFQTELEDGVLVMMVCQRGQSRSQRLLQLLAAAGVDWVAVSSPALWSNLAALQLQLCRLAANPQLRLVHGTPTLRRWEDCFSSEGLFALLEEWQDS